jgi:hypothetical protein
MAEVSYELHMANERLLARRAAVQREQTRPNPSAAPVWECPAAIVPERPERVESAVQSKLLEAADENTPPPCAALTEITLSPTLAAAFLQQKVTALARVWLLLRCLDEAGRGWLEAAEVRELLAGQDSPYRVCKARHLRTLLAEGDGRFWVRDGQRIWLCSMARVAAGLGVEWVSGRPVVLPPAVLTGPIGDFRAHLYAAFHSGRAWASTPHTSGRSAGGRSLSNVEGPVSRATLGTASGVSRRTQQAYEQRAGVVVRANYALGRRWEAGAVQERCWDKRTAVFPFRDIKGKQGPPGREYIAWQMPNSYEGPHERRPKSQNRRLNRKLADLCRKRDTGNGQRTGKAGQAGALPAPACMAPPRLYFENGAALSKAVNRRRVDAGCWPGRKRQNGRPRFWFWLEVK